MITYKFRLYPKKSQITILNGWLEQCRFLYNFWLDERKKTWEKQKISVGLYEQIKQLPKLKKTYPGLTTVYSQVLQNVGIRLDLAMQAFFRRIKRGETPGYPRFKGLGRYDSFVFPQYESGVWINGNELEVSKVGKICIEKHRDIQGVIKTVTIKRTPTGKWFAFVVTDSLNKNDFGISDKQVGIDVGVLNFATFSDGNFICNPRFFDRDQQDLAKRQRKRNKLPNNDKKRHELKRSISRIHERIANRRHNFTHQQSNKIIKDYNVICVENININNLIKKRWCSKQISDAAWGKFIDLLTYKAECAGRQLIPVSPSYTSQTCHKCGTRTIHQLKDRVFNCGHCGLSEDRDANAAKNILILGTASFKTLGLQGLCQAKA